MVGIHCQTRIDPKNDVPGPESAIKNDKLWRDFPRHGLVCITLQLLSTETQPRARQTTIHGIVTISNGSNDREKGVYGTRLYHIDTLCGKPQLVSDSETESERFMVHGNEEFPGQESPAAAVVRTN